MHDPVQPFGFGGFKAIDVDAVAWPSQFVEEYPTVCASQYTGPPERGGAMILRLDWRLRSEIGVESAERIVVSYATHDDVACDHRWTIGKWVTVVNHRRESDRSPAAVRVQ
jgi:hypothetical protein